MSARMADREIARNRVLVVTDWVKAKIFGRDVSRE